MASRASTASTPSRRHESGGGSAKPAEAGTGHLADAVVELADALLAGDASDHMLELVAARARHLVDGDAAWVARSATDGSTLLLVAGNGEEARDLVGHLLVLSDPVHTAALTAGETVVVEDLATDVAVHGSVEWRGLGQAIVVPLHGRRVQLGALVVRADARRPRFDQERAEVLELYASAAASAVEASLARAARDRRPLEVLRRAALPSRLPSVPGVRLAARYSPAGQGARVGGDWFDVAIRKDGGVALVIGDVAGSGLAACALSVQIRNSLRAFLLEGHAPAAALSRVDAIYEVLETDGERVPMATACAIVLDPQHRRLRYALAGHFPPVVIDAQPARWLERLRPGPPLGVVSGGARYHDFRVSLEPSTTIALLSDGLVERRNEDLGLGMARVVATLDALTTRNVRGKPFNSDLERLADCVFEVLDSGGDDRSLLLCRIAG